MNFQEKTLFIVLLICNVLLLALFLTPIKIHFPIYINIILMASLALAAANNIKNHRRSIGWLFISLVALLVLHNLS
jgi:hypothetical protein